MKTNPFKIHDPKLHQVFCWVTAAIVAISIFAFSLCVAQLISYIVAEPGSDLFSLFNRLYPFIELMIAALFILFVVFLTIVIYVYASNKDNERFAKQQTEVESPLLGAAKEYQAKIIELLKSVAMPAPNKQTINHARTAKFIHALTALDLIDSNRDSKHLMEWIENATGYSAGETRVFNQARKAVKINDSDVLKFQEQITQIIDK